MRSEAHSPPQGLVLQDPLRAGFSLRAVLPSPAPTGAYPDGQAEGPDERAQCMLPLG
jgi:hypothetical protein